MKQIRLPRAKKQPPLKTAFALLIFALHGIVRAETIFNYAECKTVAAFTLPGAETGKEKALSASTGIKLSFRDADFRTYITLPKTSFAELENAKTFREKASLLNEPRFGAGIVLFRKTLPVTVKAGRNSYGKSIAKLKNPAPSTTANPLVQSFAFNTGIGAALPTVTSSVQPLSASVRVSPLRKNASLSFISECFVTEEQNSAVSVSTTYKISQTVFVQNALSLSRFFIENNSSVLRKNNAGFAPGYFCAGLVESNFQSPVAKINVALGIHQSPYSTDSVWFKIDGRTSFGMFLLNASYFAVPTAQYAPDAAPLIGNSSSICRTTAQASVNPQILFLFRDKNASSLRIGFSALESSKVTSTSTPVQLVTAKFRAAVSFENRFFSSRLDWTHANILLSGTPPTKSATPEEYQNCKVNSSFAGGQFRTSISAAYTYYPPLTKNASLKELYSADVKVSVPRKNLAAQAGIELTYKDKERYSAAFDASLSYSIRRKLFRSSFKAGISVPF